MAAQDPRGDEAFTPIDARQQEAPQGHQARRDADPGADAGSTGAFGKARKVAVGLVGGAVTATGIVLMPLPGPGTAITLGGLAILATEFPAARRQLDRLKSQAKRLLEKRR